MIKRVFLFIVTNVFVIATISIVISLLGLHPYLTSQGIDYRTLAIFCAIWGTGGAFISLWMSKFIAKMGMGLKIIDPNSASSQEQYLLNKVYNLARGVGLNKMPEVGFYDSPELNAFATGPSKNNSLVAVSTGLLQNMRSNEVDAVLGHEISHVANGDMVTMTLIQGIVNSFALFLSRIIAYAITLGLSRSEEQTTSSSMIYIMLTVVFDIVFTLLGSIVVAAFSRHREYRADAGGAKLSGRTNMIDALTRLKEFSQIQDQRAPSLANLKISQTSSWMTLFASHPPIEDRIKRLQTGQY